MGLRLGVVLYFQFPCCLSLLSDFSPCHLVWFYLLLTTTDLDTYPLYLRLHLRFFPDMPFLVDNFFTLICLICFV